MGTKEMDQGNDMAAIDFRGGWYRIIFRYRGQRFTKSLGTQSQAKALRLKARLEDNLELLRSGRTQFVGGDLATFLLSDGRISSEPAVYTQTLGQLLDSYEGTWKEKQTQYTEKIHLGHMRRILGSRTPVADLNLQNYIDKRSQEKWRGKLISNVTIKKELATLSVIGVRQKGLRFPKQVEKQPFQTWDEIEAKVKNGASEMLWECLFLTSAEIQMLIDFAKAAEKPEANGLVHAMVVFAAHTGARRSEMMRSLREDVNFTTGMVTIREKKKDTGKTLTYRQVPMSPTLRRTLHERFSLQSDSHTFTYKGLPLSPQLMNHNLRRAIDGSKWEVLKGWHVLRHSFITACVMKGIDQRMIDLWVGHTTEAMRKRYTHLIPSAAKAALAGVFE